MKDTTVFLVSATPLKPLNRISWNFVVMKDIMCRYAVLQEMLIWSFWGAIYVPFFVRLPVTNAWNCHSLYKAFSSNVGAWGMWACSLFLSLKMCYMKCFRNVNISNGLFFFKSYSLLTATVYANKISLSVCMHTLLQV